MKDIAIKILSHFSKNALASMVVTMALIIAGYWYNDYKQSQDDLKINLEKVIDGQIKIKGDVTNSFSSVYAGLDDLMQGQAAINAKIDILKNTQPTQVQQQVDQIDNLVEQLTVRNYDTIVLNEIPANTANLNYEITAISIPVDTIKKKNFFQRINIFRHD